MSTIVKIKKLQAQVARYILSFNDFEEALSYLYAKPAENTVVIRRTLLTAAIIAYARPFTNNKTCPSAGATPTVALKYKKILSEDELAQHDRLFEMRNLAIAHSTSELRPALYNLLDPPAYIAGHQVFDLLTQTINNALFASACEKLHSACLSSISKLHHQIHKAASLESAN